METNEQIFLNFLKERGLPREELDMELAKKNKLRFDDNEVSAAEKSFITEESLDFAFRLVQRAARRGGQ